MKPSELKTVLTEMIKNNVEITPFIWGQHGIGKSSIVKQVAKELGYNCMTLILSQKESVDLAGIPYIFEDMSTGEKVTCNYMPDWFNAAAKKGKLIIFFDEFNMARRETMAAAFEVVLEKTLNNKRLPKDVFLIAAGNPEDDRYTSTPMSQSLIDRFMHIHFQPEVPEWLEWAKNSGVHVDIVEFISANPTSGYTKDARDSKFPVEIKHSFRSWGDRASPIWSLKLPQSLKEECLVGIVGLENTAAFVKFQEANQEKPFEGLEALENGDKVKTKFNKWYSTRADLVAATVSNVLSFVAKSESKFNAEQLTDFICALPADQSVDFLRKYSENPNNLMHIVLENTRIKKIIDDFVEVKEKTKEKS